MSRHARIEARAVRVFAFFRNREDQSFTKPQVCQALELQVGKTTDAAFRRVRVLAEDAGWYFPEAVPAVDFRYILTKDASKLIDPALHLGRLEAGVRRAKKRRIDQIKTQVHSLSPADKPTVKALLRVEAFQAEIVEQAQRLSEDLAKDLIATRKAGRGTE